MVLHVPTHLAKKKVAILKQKQHSTPAYWVFHQDSEKELTFPGSGSYLKKKGSRPSHSHREERIQPWTLNISIASGTNGPQTSSFKFCSDSKTHGHPVNALCCFQLCLTGINRFAERREGEKKKRYLLVSLWVGNRLGLCNLCQHYVCSHCCCVLSWSFFLH